MYTCVKFFTLQVLFTSMSIFPSVSVGSSSKWANHSSQEAVALLTAGDRRVEKWASFGWEASTQKPCETSGCLPWGRGEATCVWILAQ